MLGLVDLTHAAGPQSLRQPVLAQLPRLAGLLSQGFDVVRTERREQGPEDSPEPESGQIEEEWSVGERQVGPARQCDNERARGDHCDEDSRPPPGVRDEQAVGHQQREPEQAMVTRQQGRTSVAILADEIGGGIQIASLLQDTGHR